MNSDDITQIILAIISIIVPLSTLVVSVRTHTNSNSAQKKQNQNSSDLQKQIQDLREESIKGGELLLERIDRNDLQTCRIDFRQVLHDSPDNIPACLEIARIYFLNLGGNADMGRKFLAWVKRYNVEQWAQDHAEDISNLVEAAKYSA